jgi:predicted dehydrogenase
MTRLFRCGVIGLGRIGAGFDDNTQKSTISTHAGAYSVNRDVDLVSFCDIDKNKLVKYGKKYDITRLYTDFDEMFKNERLDCVSICTRANSHLKVTEAAVKWNVKGIFLEKPISDTLRNASKIISICKKKKIKLQIDHQRRFQPFYNNVKRTIFGQDFGRIQHVNLYYGSGITNTGSHMFDIIRYFFGDIKWVEGIYGLNPSNNLSDPNIDGRLFCKSGAICSLHSFDVSNYGILELDILGTKGRIRLNLAKSYAEYFKVSKKKGLVYRELTQHQYTVPKTKDAIVLGVENIIHSIRKNVEPMCTGYDGYSSLEAIIAIKKSANKKGQRVFLPLKMNNYKVSSR